MHNSTESLSSGPPRTPSSSHVSVAALSEHSSSSYAEPSPHGHRRVHSDGNLAVPGRSQAGANSPRSNVESRLFLRARRILDRLLAAPPGTLSSRSTERIFPADGDADLSPASAFALASALAEAADPEGSAEPLDDLETPTRSASFIAPLRSDSTARSSRTLSSISRAGQSPSYRVCDMLSVLVASRDFSARENALSFLQQLQRAGILIGPVAAAADVRINFFPL